MPGTSHPPKGKYRATPHASKTYNAAKEDATDQVLASNETPPMSEEEKAEGEKERQELIAKIEADSARPNKLKKLLALQKEKAALYKAFLEAPDEETEERRKALNNLAEWMKEMKAATAVVKKDFEEYCDADI